jgi:glutamate-ammonia-ligase adenylyltransferase
MLSPRAAAAVDAAADPATVEVAMVRLIENDGEMAERLEGDGPLLAALVAVADASRSLTQRLVADSGAINVLADLDARPRLDGAPTSDQLVQWRHREMLRIAARDLTGRDGLEEVCANLSALAADVLEAAVSIAGAQTLAVVGMGKLGAIELNYASDIDVLFVGDGPAREAMGIARSCFRVDADLRPEGRDGPLTRSLASYEGYWDEWAEPWEFQALLKARAVAGDADLGRAFENAASQRLWTRTFSADDLRSLRSMKARAEALVASKGLSDRELKRGRGGIRDVEFSVQLLQLVHGRADPALRMKATLDVLQELSEAGYVDADDATALADAYRFLRTVEHRLQLADEQQVHAVPAQPAARNRLARVLGYRDQADATALDLFDEDLRHHQAVVRSIHERLYFRPLLEVFSGSPAAVLVPEAVQARLDAFGFADADRTRQALEELTRGLTRASRLMQQFLPVLLDWLSESPDPDLGLLGLRTLADSPHQATRVVTTFRESPEAARQLCSLLGTSRLFAQVLDHHPDLIGGLTDGSSLAAAPGHDLHERAASTLGWRGSFDERRTALRRIKSSEDFRIAARDVLGLDDLGGTASALTDLAETVLDVALEVLDPDVRLAVVGLGRLGSGELSYASDLDVIVLHEGDRDRAGDAVESLVKLVAGATPAEGIYDVDLDLRPEGRSGAVTRTLDSYRAYYEKWAETWERQAFIRARPVAGDLDLGRAFCEMISERVWGPLDGEDERSIRRMKARIERERIPRGEDPQFHLKLGRGSLSDIEWTVQLLQLRHGVRLPATLAALAELEEAGHMSVDDAAVLREAYLFCEVARNRLFLVKGSRSDSLPSSGPLLAKVARSLDTHPVALRDDYRRVTRRSRQVVERLFYESS